MRVPLLFTFLIHFASSQRITENGLRGILANSNATDQQIKELSRKVNSASKFAEQYETAAEYAKDKELYSKFLQQRDALKKLTDFIFADIPKWGSFTRNKCAVMKTVWYRLDKQLENSVGKLIPEFLEEAKNHIVFNKYHSFVDHIHSALQRFQGKNPQLFDIFLEEL